MASQVAFSDTIPARTVNLAALLCGRGKDVVVTQTRADLDRTIAEKGRPATPSEAIRDERQEVLELFPLEEWPDLPLDRYALGMDSTAPFCLMMEFRTNNLGSIRGGSSGKHIMYRRRQGGWWLAGTLDGLPPEDAWARLRGQFVQAFDAGRSRDFDRLDELELLRHGQALVTKSLATYFPDQFVPIYSSSHLRQFLELFGAEPEKGAPAWRLNRQLLRLTGEHPVLGGWDSFEVMRLLYDEFAPAATGDVVWKIAPGERGRMWDECLAAGQIRVGWGEVGDLSQYASETDLQEQLAVAFPEKKTAALTRLSRNLLRFRDLTAGAWIVANRGKSEILAAGKVTTDGYRFEADHEYQHVVSVDWDTAFAQTLDAPVASWTATFAPVSRTLWTAVRQQRGQSRHTPVPAPDLPDQVQRVLGLLDRKSQVILYGPPGTGKTRLALDVALALTGHANAISAHRAERQTRIRRLLNNPVQRAQESVWLFVANPKHWSWKILQDESTVRYNRGRIDEHFERMRPGDLVVGYEATPTKKVIALSRIVSVDLTRADPVLLEWIRSVDGPEYEEWRSHPVLAASEPARNRMQGSAFRLTAEEAEIILGDEAPADTPDDVPTVSMLTFHPSYGYEDFVEAYKPTPSAAGGLALRITDGYFLRVCHAAQANPDHTYLLIIDEINRADLPRVLGELVTLLEPDKRDLPVKLPVSGRTFQIPPNIRIIGTMNTADRSVAHLDAAVRRRFAFVPVNPDPDVLDTAVGALALGRMLAQLNERIIANLGPDQTLGHAFLLRDDAPVTTEEDLHAAFYGDVVPLLEDYAIGDHAMLAVLLGEEIADPRTGTISTLPPDDLLAVLVKEFHAGLDNDADDQ